MLHKPYLFVQHLAFSFNVSAIMPAYICSWHANPQDNIGYEAWKSHAAQRQQQIGDAKQCRIPAHISRYSS